jgi:hypothetical protein
MAEDWTLHDYGSATYEGDDGIEFYDSLNPPVLGMKGLDFRQLESQAEFGLVAAIVWLPILLGTYFLLPKAMKRLQIQS